ncbi:hypothetical protein Pcinc_008471 [Petrolisthes cinctipes]|uniref:Uncharacterized protein n=1 Tax=Petrolisthes cinctipes TaxID=88211 RepID=A0AAE1G8T9_PETCI|nr:hypothetical protein Pcinc_008471 [Petrolisthes cinctipes]
MIGPRQQQLRRFWENEAAVTAEEEEGRKNINSPSSSQYISITKKTYTHPHNDNDRESQLYLNSHSSSCKAPAITSPPTTFWTHHRGTIHATTTPGAAVSTFPRSAAFTTPITQALDPPAWTGWHPPPPPASHTLFTTQRISF